MLLKGFVVNRPSGTKLQNKNGDKNNYYVYHVISKEYIKEKKYVKEQRVCVGKLLDAEANTMIPNENFGQYYPDYLNNASELPEPPAFSDVLKAGGIAAIRSILDSEGLHETLSKVYDSDTVSDIENILAYITLGQSASFQHYPSFMRNHLCEDSKIISDSHISSLLSESINEITIKDTIREWNSLRDKSDCVYVGYDSTNFNTCGGGITFAEFGKAKDDPSLRQVNFSMAVSQKDTTPLFYELYKGSIVDLSQCGRMVGQMQDLGYRDIGFILDRGYCTIDNIRHLDDAGYDFMMMAKTGTKAVSDVIKAHGAEAKDIVSNYLPECGVCGVTVKGKLFEGDAKDRYFHVYYDERRASDSRMNFAAKICKLENELKSLVGKKLRANANLDDYRDYFDLEIRTEENTKNSKKEQYLDGYSKKTEKIKEHLDMLGYFVLITTRPHTAEEALTIYRGRDNVEKLFRSIKSGMDFDTPGVHSDKTLISKIHLMFLSAIIWNRLLQISRAIKTKTSNRKDFTVPGIIDQLESIECIRKNTSGYLRKYALTAKQKLILEQLSITEQDIDTAINKFRG